MEIINANIETSGEKRFLLISTSPKEVRIPLCEDRPNEVKKAFNLLIERIKEGEFQIELAEVGTDLFSQVSLEYINQLNKEILEVAGEMVSYGLVGDTED